MKFVCMSGPSVQYVCVYLCKGYHQIPMQKEDIPKTTFIAPFGLFEYTRMTFDMRNASNTFQQLMDWVMAGPV